MKINKKVVSTLAVCAAVGLVFFSPEIADAAGNFAAVDRKGKDAISFLTGTLSVIVISIALIIVIIMGMMDRLDKSKLQMILGGAIAISFVGEIVVWLMAK